MKRRMSPFSGATHCQIAHAHIYPDNAAMAFRGRVCCLDFQGDQQVELLAGFVIPEFGRTDARTLLDKSDMLAIARIGDNHAPIQTQDTHLLLFFEAVIMAQLIGQASEKHTWELDPVPCSVSS